MIRFRKYPGGGVDPNSKNLPRASATCWLARPAHLLNSIAKSHANAMSFRHAIRGTTYQFSSLRDLLAKASPLRSGDQLAGIAAATQEERVAARFALADLPLAAFLSEAVVPYESDEVTRLIFDSHDRHAFAAIASFTVGQFRDSLLSDEATTESLAMLAPGITPEMAAAVSKLMQAQALISLAQKIRVITGFRRALFGSEPATDNPDTVANRLPLSDLVREKFSTPTESCALAQLTTQMT